MDHYGTPCVASNQNDTCLADIASILVAVLVTMSYNFTHMSKCKGQNCSKYHGQWELAKMFNYIL